MAESMEIPKESLQDLTVCALLHDNALTETRPYKAGMHHKKAIAILQENAARGWIGADIVAQVDACFR